LIYFKSTLLEFRAKDSGTVQIHKQHKKSKKEIPIVIKRYLEGWIAVLVVEDVLLS